MYTETKASSGLGTSCDLPNKFALFTFNSVLCGAYLSWQLKRVDVDVCIFILSRNIAIVKSTLDLLKNLQLHWKISKIILISSNVDHYQRLID